MNVCIENKNISKDEGENLESLIDWNIPGYVLYNYFMDSLIRVPTIPNRTQIPQATIHSLVEQISGLFHPKKIILFGSYAYGTPRPESDVDLLVVMDTQLSELEQAAVICRAIPYRFGLDLVVYTPQRLAQRLEWGDSFLREIIQRGITLYESAHN
jgi:predicted nucleotidyltransferase